MTQILCDKCRAEIDPRTSTVGSRSVKVNWSEYDLCAECMSRLELWLKTHPSAEK